MLRKGIWGTCKASRDEQGGQGGSKTGCFFLMVFSDEIQYVSENLSNDGWNIIHWINLTNSLNAKSPNLDHG